MLDIVILSNSSKKDVIKSLNSIFYQFINVKINVYIVDYNKKIDYTNIVNDYSNIIDIFELKCDEEINIGKAKQYALTRSKGKYIMFINSGDVFSFPYAINLMIEKIKNENSDMIYSNYYIKFKDGYVYIEDDKYTLNAKIYRREFLIKNKIKFNYLTANFSFSLNKLIELFNAKITFFDKNVFIVKDKNILSSKSGRYELDYFGLYLKDILFIIDYFYSKKLKIDNKKLSEILLTCIYFSYLYYLKNQKNIEKKNIKKIYDLYLHNSLSTKEKNEIIIKCLDKVEILELIVNADVSFSEFLKIWSDSSDRHNNTCI